MAIRRTPARIRSKFRGLIKDMAQNNHAFVKNPGKDFSRYRICTFENTVLNLITMETHSLNRELSIYYDLQGQHPPTKSAFTQARQKLLPETFLFLLKEFNALFPLEKTFKGLHVLGCDGTDSNIPADENDSASFIPYNSKGGGYYQFHTVVMYDLLEKRYTDAIIQPRHEVNESAACCTMVDQNPVEGNCLYIGDRGFVSYNLMVHIHRKGHFFLFRLKDIHSERSAFKDFRLPPQDDCETDCTFILSRKRVLPPASDNICYKYLRPDRDFDFIPPGDKRSTYTLPFRLVRLKIEDSYEYLITNLPAKTASLPELRELYHLRWKIETSFLFLKYGMAMNYFHCVIRSSVSQEILAKLVLSNFISLVLSCVELPYTGTKYHYRISMSDAIYKCRQFLLFQLSNNEFLTQLLRDKTPIRPGRCSVRNMRSQVLKSLQNRT